MKFKAFIDGVHFDPKKGAVKIVLVATSYVSMDELTTVGPKDESIWVTLESEQTKLEVFPLTPTGVAVEPGSREESELEGRRYHDPDDIPPDGVPVDEEVAERLRKADVDDDEDELDGGGQGGII